MYAFLVVLLVSGWIPEDPVALERGVMSASGGSESPWVNKRVAYSLFSHFVGFFVVAHLSSYLVQKLKAAGDELAEKRETLAKIQALNKNIIDSITSGIITTDLAGRITFLNRGAEEITGKSLTQVEGSDVGAFLGCEEGFVERLAGRLEDTRRHRFEAAATRSGGDIVHLGVTSAMLRDQRADLLGYVFSFQDLTEIKTLEEEVRLKDRMAALGEMAAGIAHEIRNPLASMSGSAQILKKSLRLEEEEGELLDIVVSESRRLDDIIREFLLFARPRRSRARPIDLVPVLNDALRLLRNSDEFTDRHNLVTDFDRGGVHAKVDADLLRQVFWNLARNALKAMPNGGSLTIRARQEAGAMVNVSFIDEGVGMDDEEVNRAFEPFHGSFGEGTGLGLAVVFRILQEHEGKIRIVSRRGHGTEVIVTLPSAARALVAATGGMS